MSSTCNEIICLRRFLRMLGVFLVEPTSLYADNTSVIQIASNPVFHERTKQIKVNCHFIRQHALSDYIGQAHHLSQPAG